MNKIIKNTLILFAITLVAGFGLGFVYNVTSDARAKQEEKTKLEAYKSVMNQMESFDEVVIDSTKAADYIKNLVKKNESANNISTIKAFNADIDNVILAKDSSENELGYIVTSFSNKKYL